MSKIKAGTTTTTAYQVEADTTGTLVLQTGSTPTTALTIGTDQSTTLAGNLNVAGQNMTPYTGFKNRIINGAMVIDQRNAGASVSISNTTKYPLDRFPVSNVSDGVISAEQSSTAPSGFKKSLKITVTTADASVGATQYAFIRQVIEGYNVADFGLGASGASSFTVSFWVQSSVTGTFGGAIQNAGENRAYAFTYVINAANTWEQKTVTIAGDTSGTWATDNTAGLILNLSLGVGSTYSSTANTWAAQTSFNATGSVALLNTLNATFYITGVQLEKGSTATSFDYRPYGTELQLCQRYYFFWDFGTSVGNSSGPAGVADSTTLGITPIMFPVTMRSSPSSMDTSGTAADYAYRVSGGSTISCNGVPSMNNPKPQSAWVNATVASGLTAGACVLLRGNNASVSKGLGFNAEL